MTSAASSAPPDLSRVTALSNKASDFLRKGLSARAADKFGQAADAAQAALPDAEDSLIIAWLRTQQARALESSTRAPGRESGQSADALTHAYGTLLPAAMTALEARRAAGTLMPGCCRAVELTWHAARIQQQQHALGLHDTSEAFVMCAAQCMGYETHCAATLLALWALADMRAQRTAAAAPHAARMMALLVSGLELAAVPRGEQHRNVGLAHESVLIDEVSTLMRGASAPRGLAECWQPLLAPWQRLQESGVLQQRPVDAVNATTYASCDSARAAAVAAAAAPGLRACALPACGVREAHVSHYKLCGACKTVVYCCKAHQAEHWPAHKAACKAARAAAATQS
jgi:hypothetical protein